MQKTKKGMVREDKNNKLNYLSYFTPYVLQRYAKHMKKNEVLYGRSNWKQGGYEQNEYLESLTRHLIALWDDEATEDHAAAIMFNIVGYIHEDSLKEDYEK